APAALSALFEQCVQRGNGDSIGRLECREQEPEDDPARILGIQRLDCSCVGGGLHVIAVVDYRAQALLWMGGPASFEIIDHKHWSLVVMVEHASAPHGAVLGVFLPKDCFFAQTCEVDAFGSEVG